jgi:hypothetical protein
MGLFGSGNDGEGKYFKALQDLADVQNLRLVVLYHGGAWQVVFDHAAVRVGSKKGVSGEWMHRPFSGKRLEDACKEYCNAIRGKDLQVGVPPSVKVIVVPSTL